MSTTAIVIVIALLLVVLLIGAVIMQTVERNNRERRQMESLLHKRVRNFHYMLDGFPKNFLSPNLKSLVCTCIQDTYEQLIELSPKNADYKTQLTQINTEMEQIRKDNTPYHYRPISDAKQVKDIQQLLSTLYNFIVTLRKAQRISSAQAQQYASEIKRLIIQTSVDALSHAAATAQQQEKFRLAIHYYGLAIEKLRKRNEDGYFDTKIDELKNVISQLEAELQERQDYAQKIAEEQADAWESEGQQQESWKKKAIYD